MLGPYQQPSFPNFCCSAVGLVPKKSANLDPESTDNWRFIHDLSTYPRDGAVNSWVSDEHGVVQHMSFDMLINTALNHKNNKISLRELQLPTVLVPRSSCHFLIMFTP